MRIFDYLEMFKTFNHLVKNERTGTPSEFAQMLGISRTTLYDIIDMLKMKDVDVVYSRSKQSFFYKTPVSLEIKFDVYSDLTPIEESEMKKIDAGMQLFPSVLFYGRKSRTFVSENEASLYYV